MSWKFEAKDIMREMLTENRTDTVATVAGFLPAETALCVIDALAQGTIDLDTHLWLFDYKWSTLEKARKILIDLGFTKINMASGNACENITHLCQMGAVRFDYLFLDLCGEFNEAAANAIKTASKVNKDVIIAVTVTAWSRLPANRSFSLHGWCKATNKQRKHVQSFDWRDLSDKMYDAIENTLTTCLKYARTNMQIKFVDTYSGKGSTPMLCFVLV